MPGKALNPCRVFFFDPLRRRPIIAAMRPAIAVPCFLLFLLLPVAPLEAQTQRTREQEIKDLAKRIAARIEIQPLAAEPAWARRSEPPRFTFALVADIHLRASTVVLEKAMAAINEAAPAFVIILGDNISPRGSEAGHRRLKGLLDLGLRPRYHIIKGDNDARDYSKVWGSTHWSFAHGGVHFLASGLDADVEAEGIGTIDEDTWKWLAERLAAHRDKPTLYFQHENILPPTFAHAPRLGLFLGARPQVAGIVTGHLHNDLAWRVGPRYYLCVPGLGPSPRHGWKLCSTYRDGIVVRTLELEGDTYRRVNKWQWMPFPRGHALKEEAGPAATADYQRGPARETRLDDPLLHARWERFKALLERLPRLRAD